MVYDETMIGYPFIPKSFRDRYVDKVEDEYEVYQPKRFDTGTNHSLVLHTGTQGSCAAYLRSSKDKSLRVRPTGGMTPRA